MEGNLASGNMMQSNVPYGGFDLQGSMGVHHHQQRPLGPHHHHNSLARQGSIIHPPVHENFPLAMGTTLENNPTISLADYNSNKTDTLKSASDEDDHNLAEDLGKGKRASTWQRVKWTDNMVRLLITAVSYIGEETSSDHGNGVRRKFINLQKKGKWKSVSKVMAERGLLVSPQQCEDKFNDLNKRYKRLNEILGRGTTCEVVENPTLLDVMDHIPEKSKDEVRKILSSKHLHYEEMCSYHNGNRLHLPADPELQRSLKLALRCRDDHDESDMKRHLHDDNDEVEQEASFEDRVHEVELEEHHQPCAKRVKQYQNQEEFSFKNPMMSSIDANKGFNFQVENDADQVGPSGSVPQKNLMSQKKLELEEQRLNIEVQMLDLEQERFRWQRFCKKKDRELDMMKMDIERMRLENERMSLEIKRKELGIDNN